MAFFQKIIAFFMAVIAFFTGLFSGGKKPEQPTPEPSNPTAYTYYDYAYGSAARQTLDLVLPPNGSGDTGLVLYIHGGAWIQGSKDAYRDALNTAASLGYAAGAINYRYLSDTVHMDSLMADVSSALGKMKELAAGQGMQLNVCFNYGGRDEIVRAARKYALDYAAGKVGQLDEKAFSAYLDSAAIPDPELIIRTGGEQRTSNFLLWQSAYAEYYFTDTLWPDVTPAEIDWAIDAFNHRERRYGGAK